MGNEQLSDVDFLRSLADLPDLMGISVIAPVRLRSIAAEMDRRFLGVASQECPEGAESGSFNEDAETLEEVAGKLPKDEADKLYLIASRLKSVPEPSCEYCNGHGFFFPNTGFELREEKEVRVRICDCKAGTKRCLSEIEEGISNIVDKTGNPTWGSLVGTLKGIQMDLIPSEERTRLGELIVELEEAQS